MGHATPAEKKKARNLYEVEGWTLSAIATEFSRSQQTVRNWKKAGNWQKGFAATSIHETTLEEPSDPQPIEEIVAEMGLEPVVDPVREPLPTPSVQDEVDDRDLRIRELEAEIARKDEEIQKHRPSVDIGRMMSDTVEWLTEQLGEEYWEMLAQNEWAQENRNRAKSNLPPINMNDYPDMKAESIAKHKARVAARFDPDQPPVVFAEDARPSRKIKLIIDRKQSNGMMLPTIEQIPYEGHINNVNGSLADGLVKYTRKGFKVTDPLLCFAQDCFKPAAVIGERYLYDCYCSEYHRTAVEGGNKVRFDTAIATSTAGGYTR